MEEKKAGEKFPEYDKSDTVLSPKEQLLSAQKRSSNFKEQVIKSMAMFFVVAACILFYFALLRLSEISYAVKSFLSVAKPIIYGLAIAYLLNPIVKVVDSKLVPFFEKKMSEDETERNFFKRSGNFSITGSACGGNCSLAEYDDSTALYQYPGYDRQCTESDEPFCKSI